MRRIGGRWLGTGAAITAVLVAVPEAAGHLVLGPEEHVHTGRSDIVVPGYSVPSFVFWNGDARPDLVVGEGGGTTVEGKVRVYLDGGAGGEPEFTDFFYAQSLGHDLVVPGGG